MSDTPETDATQWVTKDFARKLERERDEARKERGELRSVAHSICARLRKKDKTLPTWREVSDRLQRLEKERAELRAEVERLKAIPRTEIDSALSYLPKDLVIQHQEPFAAMALTFARLNHELAELKAYKAQELEFEKQRFERKLNELRESAKVNEADKARLDWLDSGANHDLLFYFVLGKCWMNRSKTFHESWETLRDAIDSAMKVAE